MAARYEEEKVKVSRCESILQYTFQNKLLCLEGLQMSGGVLNWDDKLRTVGKNDRLAVLGNAVLRAHLCKMWYDNGRARTHWTHAEQTLVKTSNLSYVGSEMGLRDSIILNHGTTIVSDNMMAKTVAALLGAVMCDGGEDALAKVVDVLSLDDDVFLKPEGKAQEVYA